MGLDLQTTCYPACFCLRCVTHSFQSDAAASRLEHYHRATHVLLRIGTTAYLHVCCVQIQHARLPHVSDIISFARTIQKVDNKTVYRALGSLVILTSRLLSCICECFCTRNQASPCNATRSPSVLMFSRVMTPPCPRSHSTGRQ